MTYAHNIPTRLLIPILLCLTVARTSADDIEVYLQPPIDSVPPNILFVLDESGSMDDPVDPGNPFGDSRRDALVSALRDIVGNSDLDNVNAALLGYTTRTWRYNSGTRLEPLTGDFSVVGEDRGEFLHEIESLGTLNYTPTTDALAAAVDWFRQDRAATQIHNNHMISSPLNGDPETLRCAPNRIILLSDGAPNATNRTHYEGIECAEVNLFNGFNGRLDDSDYNTGARCANEIATWAYETDLATGAGWEGVQNIETYTISFGTEEGSATRDFMDGIVEHSGGESVHVATEDELRNAFEWMISDAESSIDYAMNAPSIPFNQDNSAVSGDYIYVPLFYPEARTFWRGNLKKYTMDVSDDEITLRAQGNQPVLDGTHNFSGTVDLFCQGGCESDGGEPLIGGAARNMTGERTLFTNLNPAQSLDHATNRIHASNNDITYETLDVADEDTRTTLLQWISRDPAYVATDTHPARDGVMGAPIHARPEVVRYGNQSTVYLPTSEGVLEAIDSETGEELWAFMPQELMVNIDLLRNNDPSDTPYYGLDGPLTIYETGGRKIAIIGMRRGGEKYYMLDITDRMEPEFISEISQAASPSEFSQLGQTWSKPLFVRMRINGTERDVLIFGGGYDPDQDNNTGADDQGNVIYVVDARDGTYLVSISNTNADHIISSMENAIPSNLATVDINGNGVVDRIYAADVGGKIIRVDFPDSDSDGSATTGGIVADINHSSQTGNHKKFFTTPQVGYYARGTRQFLVLMIGTGDHANPLDTDVDRFYMIKDNDIWGHTITDTVAGSNPAHFIDATDTVLNNGGVLDDSSRGWFIDLDPGEKSYSRAILYDYSIFFTTYYAERITPEDPCTANSTSGTAKIYGLDLISADAAINWNGNTETELTIADRSLQLSLQGIPPSPMLVFPGAEDEHGNTTLGKKIFLFADLEKKHEWGDRFRPIYWEEVIDE